MIILITETLMCSEPLSSVLDFIQQNQIVDKCNFTIILDMYLDAIDSWQRKRGIGNLESIEL